MAAQSSILAWRIPLTKEVGCSPWSGKESHAQTQPPEVNWHVQSHGWQMPELSSDPKLWVLLFFFFFPSPLWLMLLCISKRNGPRSVPGPVTHPENQQALFPFPWLLDTCPITSLLSMFSFVCSLFVLRYAFVLKGNFDTTKS